MTMTDTNNLAPPSNDDYNGWADFWRNDICVNVMPADTRNKVTRDTLERVAKQSNTTRAT